MRTTLERSAKRPPKRRKDESTADRAAELLELALAVDGAALRPAIREEMEARFGHDLRHVRVHTDERADAVVASLDAEALTFGEHVLFAAGRYQPESVEGRMLLAHELAHVLQAPPSPGSNVVERDEPARNVADIAALEPDLPEQVGGAAPIRADAPPTQLLEAGPEARALEAAGRALAWAEPAELAPERSPARPRLARFVRALPLRDSVASLADPFVEDIAVDVARSLERDPDVAAARVRRRLARFPVASRAAVVARVQELLTPAQRERAAVALTGAAVGEADVERRGEAGPEAHLTEDRERAARLAVAPERARGEEEQRAEAERRAVEAGPPGPEPAPGPVAEVEPPTPLAEAETIAPLGGETEPAAPAEAEEAERMAAVGTGEAEAVEQVGALAEARREVAAVPGPGEGGPGGSAAQLNLGPISELEQRVEERGGREEEAAREQEAAAAEVESEAQAGAEGVPAAPAMTEPEPESAPQIADIEPRREQVTAEVTSPSEEAAPPEVEPAAVEEPETEEPGTEEPTPEVSADLAIPEPRVTEAPDRADQQVASSEPVADRRGPAAEPRLDVGDGTITAPAAEPQTDSRPEAQDGQAAEEGTQREALGGDPAAEVAAGAQATGDCGPDVGGAGGGGTAVETEPAPAPPDVSGAEPTAAMGAIGSLAPVEMGRALGAVGQATSRQMGERRADLASNPPSMERPAGSPETRPSGAIETVRSAAGDLAADRRVEQVPATRAAATPIPERLPAPPPPPTQAVSAPAVTGGAQREVTPADAQVVRGAVDSLPVTDPGLEVTAGPPPVLQLEDDSDPALQAEQRGRLEGTTLQTHQAGRREAAAPQGETDIYPSVEPEVLRAEIPVLAAADATASPTPTIPESDEATAIVAREQRAEEARTAASHAQAQMVADQERHEVQASEERARSSQEMDELVRRNTEEQETLRDDARQEVREQRREWGEAQDAAVETSRAEADAEDRRVARGVETERSRGEADAARHIEEGNRQAGEHRSVAERDARAERDRGRQESSGILGWLADRARAFFDGIKRGIQRVFEAARALVRRAIEAAQRLATEAIERARRAIVAVIQTAGAALMAIGDRLLAAFPEARARFRGAIRRAVDHAVAGVNRLADELKEGVKRALAALGALLDGLLNVLERAYLAAIEIVASAVGDIIRAAQSIVQAFAAFAQLIVDVASNPGQWLRNLGASIMDGLRNHVWNAIKCAVKNWFNSKIEEILGLARLVWDLLRGGGIRLAEIGRLVWEAIIASLPGILIQLAIEKLVSLLVPAAAAVMLIIDGLRAAWGAISRIIAAFETFFRFLKAVKSGDAGRQFAQALAAGAIALIDFLANFLLIRLRGPAQGVAGRLRALAQRIGARLQRVGRAVARGARRAMTAVRAAGTRAAGAVRTAARTAARRVAGAARGAVRAIARAGRRVAALPGVRVIVRGARAVAQRARPSWRRLRARARQRRVRRRQRREQRRREALSRAARELPPRIRPLLAGGVSRIRLVAQLLGWKLRYRLRRLALIRRGRESRIVAANSPDQSLIEGILTPHHEEIHRILVEESEQVLNDPQVIDLSDEIMDQRLRGFGRAGPGGITPILVPPSPSGAAAVRDIRRMAMLEEGGLRVRQPVPGGMWTAARVGRRQIRSEQEYLALTRSAAHITSDVYIGRSLHPGSLVVIGPGSYRFLSGRQPVREKDLARAIAAVQMGATPRGRITVPEHIHAAAEARLSQIEAARASGGLAQQRLLNELRATGAITPAARRALDPAAISRAGAAGRAVDIQTGVEARDPRSTLAAIQRGGLPSRLERTRLVREYLRREVAVVSRFIEAEVGLADELFASQGDVISWLRTKFRERLAQLLRSEVRSAEPTRATLLSGGVGR